MIAKRESNKRSYPVKGSLYLGTVPCVLSGGYLVAATAKGVCVGVITMQVDNSEGADGDVFAEVSVGEHRFANVGDISLSEVGETAYFSDLKTVSKDSNSSARATAGVITQVDSDGVWLRVGI